MNNNDVDAVVLEIKAEMEMYKGMVEDAMKRPPRTKELGRYVKLGVDLAVGFGMFFTVIGECFA